MTSDTKIFVFGSNLAGIHGAGAAKHAFDHCGAKWGVGVGLTGDSYALPTKDFQIRTLPLYKIRRYVKDFMDFAKDNPDLTFQVTRVGCGLAGLKPSQIAPMFEGYPSNCEMPQDFLEILGQDRT